MRSMIWGLFALALLLLWTSSAAAQSPQDYVGPGGQITGYVIGVNGYPVDWALVNATDGQHFYTAFSGMSGGYLMWVPVGSYNVSVHVAGFWANSATANVTNYSTVRLDFHLMTAPMPVPEFELTMAPVVLLLSLALAVMLNKRYSRF